MLAYRKYLDACWNTAVVLVSEGDYSDLGCGGRAVDVGCCKVGDVIDDE